jgi:hypothetical protein
MAKFTASGVSGAITTTLKSAVGIRQPAAATNSIQIYTLVIGSAATTADANVEYVVQRYSTAGTSTAVTPADVEDTGATAATVAGQTFTAEPTVVTNSILWDNGLNQRATYTIVWAPGYEWRIGVTNTRQVTLAAKHASATPTVNGCFYWSE